MKLEDLHLPRTQLDNVCSRTILFSRAARETAVSQVVCREPTSAAQFLVYNLALALRVQQAYGGYCGVVVSLGKREYARPAPCYLDDTYFSLFDFRTALDGLVEDGWAYVWRGSQKQGRTRVCPTELLRARIEEIGLELDVVPRGRLFVRSDEESGRRLTPFEETDATRTWRSNLAAINLANSSHTYLYTQTSGRRSEMNSGLTAYDRIFTPRMCSGGRFYSHVEGMRRTERATISIDGEPTVELDYSGLHPCLLYNTLKLELTHKAYEVPGVGPEQKEAAKLAFLILVNARSPESARAALLHSMDEHGVTLPGMSAQELLARLEAGHAPISKFFYTGAWSWLQFLDSQIAEQVMLRAAQAGHACLGVHDSFIMKWSQEANLRHAMQQAYMDIVGVNLSPVIDRK